MTGPVSLAYLTVEGAAPMAQIEAAARHGFNAAGLRFLGPPGRPLAVPVLGDARWIREIRQACGATGVRIFDVEMITLGFPFELSSWLDLLDAAAEVDAAFVQVVCEEPDHARAAENLAALGDAARARGLRLALEFMQFRAVRTIDEAAAVVARSGARDVLGILVDALHLDRSGGDAASLGTVDGIAYLQLCDAPARRPEPDGLLAEARSDRLYPGEGELPLAEMLAALPADLPISVEVPRALDPTAGIDERTRRCAGWTRDFFERNGIRTPAFGLSA